MDERTIDCKDKKIIVVGDFMLDGYVDGTVSRVSHEAGPVLILEKESMSYVLGGAGNLVDNLSAIGVASIFPIGVCGRDEAGDTLIELLNEKESVFSIISRPPDRKTTVKLRYRSNGHQLLRVDEESTQAITPQTEGYLYHMFRGFADALPPDCVCFSDYGKGMLTPYLTRKIMGACFRHKPSIPTIVDPKFTRAIYKRCTIFKANLPEAAQMTGMRLETEKDIDEAGWLLREFLECEAVVITRGADGMAVYRNDGDFMHIPGIPAKTVDVTGCGDVVMAVLAACLAADGDMMDLFEWAEMANRMAAATVEQPGTSLLQIENSPQG